jgi:hypothetical protein
MTFVVERKAGISKQRGFWLRCFLGAASGFMLWLYAAATLNAQVDIPGPERLAHVRGLVVNDSGHPMANLAVTLVRDDKVAYQTKTDISGRFQFDRVAGQYTFKVARSQFAPASREIVVTDEVVTALERKSLYVILGPGQCQDACSSVLTSKKDFNRELRKNKR